MSYVDTNLMKGEQVVHRAQLHWAIYLAGALLSVVVIGLPMLLAAYIRQRTTEMAVTNKRVIMKTGFISRKTLELNLSKVENVAVDQGIFARMLDYGTITVVGTGGTREVFAHVLAPLQFRRAVQEQTDAGQGQQARAA
jgi:uncharacterized membrane protein YdbT with pleckstrin-like domain